MSEILVGQYLASRLKELGIGYVFGVPGPREEDVKWAGAPNELIAAYAADGYARTKGVAALVTTFGPGELSTLAGVGGSFTEDVPVVHIVGYPALRVQEGGSNIIMHHTLADLRYDLYFKMSAEISVATTVLHNADKAAAEIDRVLNAMVYHSKPIYIGIPQDVVFYKINNTLSTKLTLSLPAPEDDALEKAVEDVFEILDTSKAPVLVVDGGAARHSWKEYANPLIDALNIPFFVTSYGKGLAAEEGPCYGGPHAGAASPANVTKALDKADTILWLGCAQTDINTALIPLEHKAKTVDFQRFHIKTRAAKYHAGITQVLPKLIQAVKAHALHPLMAVDPLPSFPTAVPEKIEQDWLWNRFTSFFKPGDLVVTETGTLNIGIMSSVFTKGMYSWQQTIWGSIGFAAGSAVGGSVAAKELGDYKRLVLITGERSLQLTVQAFSMLVRQGIVPVVFVLNNGGYIIERYFTGWESDYNDVDAWDYTQLFHTFAADVPKVKTFKTHTAAELDKLLSDNEFNTAAYPQLIEMFLEKGDAPIAMKNVFRAMGLPKV